MRTLLFCCFIVAVAFAEELPSLATHFKASVQGKYHLTHSRLILSQVTFPFLGPSSGILYYEPERQRLEVGGNIFVDIYEDQSTEYRLVNNKCNVISPAPLQQLPLKMSRTAFYNGTAVINGNTVAVYKVIKHNDKEILTYYVNNSK